MYNDVSFGINLRKGPLLNMGTEKPNFEINPLDVNIVRMQHNLLKRLEKEMPENGDFAPVFEEYQSKDPTLDLSEVRVVCKYVKDDSPKKDTRMVEITCKDKSKCNERTKTLIQGTKKDIMEYLKGAEYFNTCKKLANK